MNAVVDNYPEAVKHFEGAAAAAARAGDSLFQARKLIALAQALVRAEHSEQAWKRAEAARRLAMGIGWAEGKREAEQVLALLESRQKP